jgi:hypothetical protein
MLCGCGKVSPHSQRSLEKFVEEIDEDATLDYKSKEALQNDWDRNYTDYRYDAEIGGIDCYVVDRYYKNLDLPLSDSYKIETDYTYRLCAELWDDVRVDYPSVDALEEEDDYGETTRSLSLMLVGEPYNMDGRTLTDYVIVFVHKDVIDEEVFDDYWDFYCDLMDAMEDYPEFGGLYISVYEGDTNKHFTFNGTDDDEYDKEYESYFGQ